MIMILIDQSFRLSVHDQPKDHLPPTDLFLRRKYMHRPIVSVGSCWAYRPLPQVPAHWPVYTPRLIVSIGSCCAYRPLTCLYASSNRFCRFMLSLQTPPTDQFIRLTDPANWPVYTPRPIVSIGSCWAYRPLTCLYASSNCFCRFMLSLQTTSQRVVKLMSWFCTKVSSHDLASSCFADWRIDAMVWVRLDNSFWKPCVRRINCVVLRNVLQHPRHHDPWAESL